MCRGKLGEETVGSIGIREVAGIDSTCHSQREDVLFLDEPVRERWQFQQQYP